MRALIVLSLLWCTCASAALPVAPRLSGDEAIVAVPADGFVEIARKHVLKDKQGHFVCCAEITDRISFTAKDECARFVTAAGYVRLRTENPKRST